MDYTPEEIKRVLDKHKLKYGKSSDGFDGFYLENILKFKKGETVVRIAPAYLGKKCKVIDIYTESILTNLGDMYSSIYKYVPLHYFEPRKNIQPDWL